MRLIQTFFLGFMLWATALTAHAAESELVDTGKVNAQLVSTHNVAAPGQTFYIALRTELDPGWHTYWQNPGDSGEPVQITWAVPSSVSVGDIIWPLPYAIPTGPIVNYGFYDTPYFPVPFTVSDDAVPGETLLIEADVYYLVCEEVCIPEDAQLSIQLSVGEPEIDTVWNDAVTIAISDAPQPSAIQAGAEKQGTETVFTFTGLPDGADFKNAQFFPFEPGIVDHSAPQTVVLGDEGVMIRTTASYGWDNALPDNVSGVIRFDQGGTRKGAQVSVVAGMSVPIGAANVPTANSGGAASIGLWAAIFGAFIGGLILNLMPCVFPVISIKALSIAKQAHSDKSHVRREGWIYTAGVVATFLLLTVVLLIIKAGGEQIGWGFQLQSPVIVGVLALLLFLIGLNLLGMFELGSQLQGVGGGLSERGGWMGTFFTGALAVIVATPCTAPLMAGAIGYALAQPMITTFAVFMALAIGFAAPFLLLSYSPRLLALMPKPGAWMVRFKELLSFPMFAAVIWLVWVLTMQAGDEGLVRILTAMLLIAFGIWLIKSSQAGVKALAVLSLLCGLAMPFFLHTDTEAFAEETVQTDVSFQAWSPATVTELRAGGQAVFIDFTAAWCVTCQVNKKLVLDKPDVQDIFTRTNTAFLVADWTNKNDMIAQELARHGRSGVPLYLYYPPGNNDVSPVILPQILTKGVIEKILASKS